MNMTDVEMNTSSCDLMSLEIGRNYMIKKDGVLKEAEVLHERLDNEKNVKEYYVHYNASDRRLDEWITTDVVDSPCQSSSPSHKEEEEELKENFDENGRTSDDEEKEHQMLTKVKFIDCVQYGDYELQPWYFSPYPDEFGKVSKLFVCEFCFKYMKLESSFCYHLGSCEIKEPPGPCIYKKGTLCIYEVDADENRLYCQNVCLFAKFFIDHKTIYFDLEQFFFYILCEKDAKGSHFVGYFSKEKESYEGNNLACILIFPPHQKKGYGKLLIGFSYELNKLERVTGSPEKPFSDLGELSYLSYWSWVVLDILRDLKGEISLKEVEKITCIAMEDLVTTLKHMGLTKCIEQSGKIMIPTSLIDELVSSGKYKRPKFTVDPNNINWVPPPKKPASLQLNGNSGVVANGDQDQSSSSQTTSTMSDNSETDFDSETELEEDTTGTVVNSGESYIESFSS